MAMKILEDCINCGACEPECPSEAITEGDVIFEINPRFSGTTSIRAICGHNDPDIVIRNRIFNEDFFQVEYKKGLVLRTFDNFFIEGISPIKNKHRISRNEALQSV